MTLQQSDTAIKEKPGRDEHPEGLKVPTSLLWRALSTNKMVMVPVPPDIAQALHEARQQLVEYYADRLKHVVLFGSYARGETHPESDVDVMVVLTGEVDHAKEVKQLMPLFMDLLNRYGRVFTLLPFPVSRFQNKQHPLMMNVREEGIEV